MALLSFLKYVVRKQNIPNSWRKFAKFVLINIYFQHHYQVFKMNATLMVSLKKNLANSNNLFPYIKLC